MGLGRSGGVPPPGPPLMARPPVPPPAFVHTPRRRRQDLRLVWLISGSAALLTFAAEPGSSWRPCPEEH